MKKAILFALHLAAAIWVMKELYDYYNTHRQLGFFLGLIILYLLIIISLAAHLSTIIKKIKS